MTPNAQSPGVGKPSFTPPPAAAPKPGTLQEVFNLDEGPVTLTFPASLSSASYQDLEDYLGPFLRKAKRQADQVAKMKQALDAIPKSLGGNKEEAAN